MVEEHKSIFDLMKEAEEVQQNDNLKKTKSNSFSGSTSRVKINKEIFVPEYSEIIEFCKQNKEKDIDIEQFFKHSVLRSEYKKIYGKDRGGGGWIGAVRGTIRILEKMKKQGWIKSR